jgi:hypothetical protein
VSVETGCAAFARAGHAWREWREQPLDRPLQKVAVQCEAAVHNSAAAEIAGDLSQIGPNSSWIGKLYVPPLQICMRRWNSAAAHKKIFMTIASLYFKMRGNTLAHAGRFHA